jgi:two-component system, OmpR family, phosphate regulon response regulator PhoB
VNRVLVVDDSYSERGLTRRVLEREGFEVAEAPDGPQALTAVGTAPPDLVLLDLTMAGMSGLEVLARLRRDGDLPVIIVSGRNDESDRVLALELGADDYVTKPFPVRELAARVRSVLRRARPAAFDGSLVFGDLEIRMAEREIALRGEVVHTTSREFDLLAKLASAPRKVFSRGVLLAEVWGSSGDWQDPATVTEHIRRLRHKIEIDPTQPTFIRTVRGAGYRFQPPLPPA